MPIMPKQYVLFGRPLPPLTTRRRIPCLLAGLAIFAFASLLYIVPGAVPAGPSLSLADHKFSMPKSLKGSWGGFNLFRPPSHPPPRQKNDTYGESSWYANWKWLSIPFSSSVTLDENRSLLPELRARTPIYCYYDTTLEKDKESKAAESELLLTWRKAWWAHGFKPIILSPAEAVNNPLYEYLQHRDFPPSLRSDLMAWLAWENMGGGLLAHYLLFPVGPRDDPLIVHLRRGEFPALTRWDGLDDGLFAGPKPDIVEAIKTVLASPDAKSARDFVSALPRPLPRLPGETKTNPADGSSSLFTVDDRPASLAFYNSRVIQELYPKVVDDIGTSHAAGFRSLNRLVTAHLHLTWQNIFSDGIAVLKPLPKHTTYMIAPAYELALRLAHCPDSPLPESCPPNQPKCTPCSPDRPMRVSTPSQYRDSPTLYTIGTVPHPYTSATLDTLRETLSTRWVRRTSPRDPWVADLTRDLLGRDVSGAPRLLRLKEAIASENGPARSLWFSAERDPPIPDDVDWIFGFAIPPPEVLPDDDDRDGDGVVDHPSEKTEPEAVADKKEGGKKDGKGGSAPAPARRTRFKLPPASAADGPPPSPEELRLEPGLLDRARAMSRSKTRADAAVRGAVEAWNLADTEAWRFARAYLARARVERLKWEDEETRYAGGAGTEKAQRSGWTRWLDAPLD